MHIAVPFDVETVRKSWGQASRMWGRVVANHDFLKALAAARDCSRLTLFVPSRHDVDLVSRTLVTAFGTDSSKVAVVPFKDIPTHLEASPADVMHVLDPNMWVAGHIRGQIGRRGFAVTGVTHSLGNQHFLEWALLNNANGIGPGDCLVCTTPTAQAVVDVAMTRLQAAQPGFRSPATTVIPLGVTDECFAETSDGARARADAGSERFVILSFARFNPQFKMDLLPVLNLC